jgi:hypothetical protein
MLKRSRTVLLISLVLLLTLTLQLAPIRAQSRHTVAILVVDDFSAIDLSSVQVASDQETCAVSVEGQAFIGRGASAGAPITSPHGALVYAELQDIVTKLGAEAFVKLVKVDIQSANTSGVAKAIEQAMSKQPADVYIANMSFVLLPCQFVNALADFERQLADARKAKDNNKYREIMQKAALFYDGTVFPVHSKKFQEQTGLDPLQDFFAAHSDKIVPIASAGNFGLDYPFWPAAWGQVISVSASTGEGFNASGSWDKKDNTPLLGANAEEKGKKGTRISNFGEVMLPGEYSSKDYGVIMGTSFAAPRLSVAVALYLSQVGTDYCRKKNGSPALAYGDWKNLTLQEAVTTYCPGMKAYLPN